MIMLDQFFKAVKMKEKGLPTMRFLSEKVNLSPSYLSDLLKKEMGMNAQGLVYYHLIEEAKLTLLNSDSSVL